MNPNETTIANPATPQPQTDPPAGASASGFNTQPPSFTTPQTPQSAPPESSKVPYSPPAPTGQFGSYPPTTNLPPDSFGSASSPYIPSTPVGVVPQSIINNSFPVSPQAPAQEVSTTSVPSPRSKKLLMILIPVILLVLGSGVAAYFMLSGNSNSKAVSPDYTITPKEVPENTNSTTPVESGFNNTENSQTPLIDSTTPPEGQAPVDATQNPPLEQTAVPPVQ